MSEYKLKIQERDNYCVCSVLQAIFSANGINFSQDEIAVRLTSSSNGFRIDDKKIRHFVKSRGFNYKHFYFNETPFNEPDSLLEDMSRNFGIVGLDNHVYLLLSFQDPKIILLDPKTGEETEEDIYDLFHDGKKVEFGLVKKLDS